MTNEQIIEWAKKCGWDNPATNMAPLYEFAKLVAQHEREACARVCDDMDSISDYYTLRVELICAQAIRARGEA